MATNDRLGQSIDELAFLFHELGMALAGEER